MVWRFYLHGIVFSGFYFIRIVRRHTHISQYKYSCLFKFSSNSWLVFFRTDLKREIKSLLCCFVQFSCFEMNLNPFGDKKKIPTLNFLYPLPYLLFGTSWALFPLRQYNQTIVCYLWNRKRNNKRWSVDSR